MATRTVYPDANLTGPWELDQPVPVDGSGYTEPAITAAGVLTYTDEDDSAPAEHASTLTIPASGAGAEVDNVAYIVSALTDETDLAGTPTAPSIAGTNEVQTITSDRTGGTFTIDDGGAPSGALQALDETAANVQTAIEGLAGFGVGQVSCTGGPLDVADIVVEFTGTKGEASQSLLNITDSGTGGTAVAISETTDGVAPASFTLDHAINDPQDGNNGQPQGHLWRRILVASDLGKAVTVSPSDHANNRSVAAGMLIATNPNTTTPTDATGTEDAANSGNTASFGSITTVTDGAKIVTIALKALASGYYATPDPTSEPGSFTPLFEAQSDAMTLTVARSGVLESGAVTPSDVQWGQSALWATDSFAVRPATAAAGGANLWSVLNSEDISTWIDFTNAAGSMHEVFEFDLDALPAGAIINSAIVEVAHSSSSRNALRVRLVGINADDTISPAVEQQPTGYIPQPTGEVAQITTAPWANVSDGTPLSSFSRLGVSLISSSRDPYLLDHRIYWARLSVTYDEGGPVVSNVVGPATAGDPVTWDFASDAGLGQTHYEVMVIAGSSQDPDAATVAANPLSPSTGEIVHDTGQVAGTLVRSLTLDDVPLADGAMTVGVRAWATSSAGVSVASDWATANFNITGSGTAPGAQAGPLAWNDTVGGVDVPVTVPAGVSRAWLLRSTDGTNWTIAEGGPFTVTPSTTTTLVDYNAPAQTDGLQYQVTFDNGAMTETGAPVAVGGGPVSSGTASWWLRVVADPSLNTPIKVQTYKPVQNIRAVSAEQDGRVLTATSRPLGTTLEITAWVFDEAERQALDAVFDSGEVIRVSNVLGQVWEGKRVSALEDSPLKGQPVGELEGTTQIADFHTYKVTLLCKVVA